MDLSRMVIDTKQKEEVRIQCLFSSGELFQVLKMMVGSNLKDSQLQQIVDKVKTLKSFSLVFM